MKKRLFSTISYILICLIIISNCRIISLADGQGTANIVRSGDNIIITYDGPWEYWTSNSYSVNGNNVPQNLSSIIVNQGFIEESGCVDVKNAWGSGIEGASGTFTCSEPEGDRFKYIHYELYIPISSFGDNTNLSIGYNGQNFDFELVDSSEPEEIPEVTPEVIPEVTPEISPLITPEITPAITSEVTPEVTQEVNPTGAPEVTPEATAAVTPVVIPEETKLDVCSDIVIDGYYDEWKNYPGYSMAYGNTNDTDHHIAQIYCDGEMVYIHFKTSSVYKSRMPVAGTPIPLTINNSTTVQLNVYHNQNWGPIPKGVGTTSCAVLLNYNYWSNDGGASFTAYDNNFNNGKIHDGDELELSISLAELERVTGIKADSIQQLSVCNPNLGNQGASWVGTPTGPELGVMAMAGLAGIGIISYRRKRVR